MLKKIIALIGFSLAACSLIMVPKNAKINKYKKLSIEQVIKAVSTPEQAAEYCLSLESASDSELYGEPDYWASFKKTHSTQRGDCEDAAIAAAVLLSDDGYKPLLLELEEFWEPGKSIKAHIVYVYKKKGLWGSIGINSSDVQPARYKTLDSLAKKLIDVYKEARFEVYRVLDFSHWKEYIKKGEGNLRGLYLFLLNKAPPYFLK